MMFRRNVQENVIPGAEALVAVPGVVKADWQEKIREAAWGPDRPFDWATWVILLIIVAAMTYGFAQTELVFGQLRLG